MTPLLKMISIPRAQIALPVVADVRARAEHVADTVEARLVLAAAGAWLAARAAIAAVTYLAIALTPARQSASPSAAIAPADFLAVWDKWDTQWFVTIAQAGYTDPRQSAYFPLYPLLTGALGHVLGGHFLLAGLLVSNLAALAAFVLLALLAYDLLPSIATAQRTVRLLAVTPAAFFLAAAYSDALFLALALAALLCLRRHQWLLAALAALLASLARVSAVALFAAIMVEAWPLVRASSWRIRTQIVAAIVAVPSGFALWSLFCRVRFGDPLTWVHVESTQWLHQPMWPWQAVALVATQQRMLPLLSFLQARSLLDLGPWLLLAVIGIWAARTRALPWSYLAYAATIWWLCIAAPPVVVGAPFPPLVSAGRYLLAAAPLYVPLARLLSRYPSLEWLVFSCGLAVQALALAFFLMAPQDAYGLV